ncbi:hypothetical protein FB451DRAFT_1456308 [Mycena latifolia]|nr:hypothetical protein FB451DRAFT_1456308 [Mycena latifolia]
MFGTGSVLRGEGPKPKRGRDMSPSARVGTNGGIVQRGKGQGGVGKRLSMGTEGSRSSLSVERSASGSSSRVPEAEGEFGMEVDVDVLDMEDKGASMSISINIDINMDADVHADIGGGGEGCIMAWITEMQVLIKGKWQLEHGDLKSLADTLRMIVNLDAEEGQALWDELPQLQESIWQLAQLEDIPFGNKHWVHT